MADNTGIEWTDATWNPIRGCSRVSEGCRNCYAEGVAKRFSGEGLPYEGLIAKGGQWNGQITVADHLMDWPLRKRKPQRIFVNSMSDLFHESVPDEVIAAIFGVMAAAPHHTFQVLTKRPERMRAWFDWHAKQVRHREWEWEKWRVCEEEAMEYVPELPAKGCMQTWPLPNVWLGVSVEDQATANERIPLLLQTPAAVRWISAEPLLGGVDVRWALGHPIQISAGFLQRGQFSPGLETLRPLDWVVVGGESGRNARPMHPEWARSLRDQCEAAGVPFLFKQWGEWVPGDAPPWPENADYAVVIRKGYYFDDFQWMDRLGKKSAGRTLDGVLHDSYPMAEKQHDNR